MFDIDDRKDARLPNTCLNILVPVENSEDGDNWGDCDWITLEL